MNLDYFSLFRAAGPEVLLTLGGLLALSADLLAMRGQPLRYRFWVSGGFAIVGCFAAMLWLLFVPNELNVLNGTLIVDSLSRLTNAGLIILTFFTILISFDSDFTEHPGEFFALVLFATVGMMLLASSEQMLMIFVALELTSLSLYCLAAFNKRDPNSTEAALKYFLFGGTAAAFTLFGLSLIYGASGATGLRQIAAGLQGQGLDPLLLAGIIMTFTGFGFKVAAVPFHLWAPDAYQGAPTPAAALIASGSKLASFLVLTKFAVIALPMVAGSAAWRAVQPGWVSLLTMMIVFSVLLGNLAAIAQTNFKRLLAYSAVAHAGYALLGTVAGTSMGVASVVYYAMTYGLTTVGAFGAATVIEKATGDCRISDMAGLIKRSPMTAIPLVIFILSLAGIPPLAGFFGKFYVFAAAVNSDPKNLGLLWLVAFAIAMSAVSLYYYLMVLKQVMVVPAPEDAPALHLPLMTRLALGTLAIGVVVLGCAPDLLVGPLTEAVKAAGM